MPSALPVIDSPGVACCAPLTREPLAPGDAEALATQLKALADPARLRLLSIVASSPDQEACVCDLIEPLGLAQPTVSHHLKVLRDVRFVIAERRGTFMHYRVNRACLEEFPEAARRILNS